MESQFEIKWTNFESKFDGGKQQKAFEALAYHLFCLEFGIKKGLFRYKNQAGIETDPVEVGEEIIGFQAKYYDVATNLSNKKPDLVDAIKKAKRKNPSLTKIIFYINKEFAESKEKEKKEPDYKVEIEQAGKGDGITVEWRVKSHIEIQLAKPENKYVAEYYFGGDRSIWKFIENIEKHTKNLLESINTEINYKGEKIYFQQRECEQIYEELIADDIPCIIVSGDGGTGKTAFVKRWIEENSPILFAWRLSEFNVNSLQNVLINYGNFTIYDFIDIFGADNQEKYVLLDSAESIYEFRDRTLIIEFLKLMHRNKWKIIITIRTAYLENFRYLIKEIQGLLYKDVTLSTINSDIVKKKLEEMNVLLPNNNKVLELLTIPFYLNEFLQVYSCEMDIGFTVVQFMRYLWNKKILGEPYEKDRMHIRREKTMYYLVNYKVINSSFYIRERNIENLDMEALHFLIQDEIVAEDDKNRCFISHDIYEEWTWFNYIEELYEDNQNDIEKFLAGLVDAMVVRRCFRQWLQFNLEDSEKNIKPFILLIMEQPWVDMKWKDEILIAILNSEYSFAFLNQKKEVCFKEGVFSLKRIICLLRAAGKTFSNAMQLETPTGLGWEAVITFVYQNYDKAIQYLDKNILIRLLKDWTSVYHIGSISKAAGSIAYRMIKVEGRTYIVDSLVDIILGSAAELNDEIKDMFQKIIQGERKYKKYRKVFIKLLTTPSGLGLVNSNPELVIEIAKFFWFIPNKEDRYGGAKWWGEKYGTNADDEFRYWPGSAYQTPVYWLLKRNEESTIKFLLESLNYAVTNYVCYMNKREKYYVPQISIFIDGITKKQYIDQELWCMYRGMREIPDLLTSILAALEKYLLELAQNEDSDVLFEKIKSMILFSNSVIVIAIGVSLIEAYPNKFFKLAYWFMRYPEFIELDRSRLSNEKELTFMMEIGGTHNVPFSDIYVKERKEALKEKFRRNSFETIIMEYQIGTFLSLELKNKLWDLLDKKYNEYENVTDYNEIKLSYQKYYIQLDIRRQDLKEYKQGEMDSTIFETQSDKRQKEKLSKNEEIEKEKKEIDLWVRARFEERKADYQKYVKYENYPELAYQKMKNWNTLLDDNFYLPFFTSSLKPYFCCILIRDFGEQICQDIEDECIKEIYQGIEEILRYPDQIYREKTHDDALIVGLVTLINKRRIEYDSEMLLKLCLIRSMELGDEIVSCIKKYAIELIDYIVEFMIVYQSKYNRWKYKRLFKSDFNTQDVNTFEKFWKQNKSEALNLRHNLKGIKKEQLYNCSMDSIRLAMELTFQSNDKTFGMLASYFLESLAQREYIDYEWMTVELIANWLFICDEQMVKIVLRKMMDVIKKNEYFQMLLHCIIYDAYTSKNRKRFWLIWNDIFEDVEEVGKSDKGHQKENFNFTRKEIYVNNIILEYLLASKYAWETEIKQWELVINDNIDFWGKCCKTLGYHKATLLGIGYFINHMDFEVIKKEAITWIYEIISNHAHLWRVELLTDTIYYLENYMKIYCDYYMKEIKTDFNMRNKVIKILDFMVEKESAIGFMLRDEL